LSRVFFLMKPQPTFSDTLSVVSIAIALTLKSRPPFFATLFLFPQRKLTWFAARYLS
jgi:hypothetical protein